MPRMSAGLAKNHIRRALRTVVDPEPNKRAIARLWQHFKSACAYCGRRLDKTLRQGHIDHLVHDGPNHISNRVLACPPCNGDEKREGPWLEFLRKKVSRRGVFLARKKTIETWVAGERAQEALKFDRELLQGEIAAVVKRFDRAVARLRRIRLLGKAKA